MFRRRRWLGRALLVGLIFGVLHYADELWMRYQARAAGQSRVREAEQTLDQTDPGWRLNELATDWNGRVAPPNRNVTTLCLELNESLPKSFTTWATPWRNRPLTPAINRLPPGATLTEVREAYQSVAGAVEAARGVRNRPTGGRKHVPEVNPLDTRLPHAAAAAAVASLLDADALLAAHAGDWEQATAASAGVLHLGAAFAGEPVSMLQFHRMKIAGMAVAGLERTLGWGEPPAQLLAELQPALLQEADEPRLAISFRAERALYHALFVALDTRRTRLAWIGGYAETLDDKLGEWQYLAHLPNDQAYSLGFHSRLIEVSRLPTWEQAEAFDGIERPEQGNLDVALSRLILPLLDQLPADEWKIRARLRSAAVGLACERFRQANGRWPTDLAELKDLLPAVPLDPYDGQPLRYRKLADGAVVYAVGPDRSDDGGTLSYGNPQPGEDVGFRLWDVAARRQPAPEEQP